jgi:hypothetical protein
MSNEPVKPVQTEAVGPKRTDITRNVSVWLRNTETFLVISVHLGPTRNVSVFLSNTETFLVISVRLGPDITRNVSVLLRNLTSNN